MPGVNASLSLSLSASLSGIVAGSSTPIASASVSRAAQFVAGNAALGTADLLYTATRTLAASATETLDLTGTLLSPIGGAFNAAEIMAIIVEAAAANTNTVNIGGAATNAFVGPFGASTHTVKVANGQFQAFVDTDGWPVTAGTADMLQIANGGAGTPVTYTITIIGRSVAN